METLIEFLPLVAFFIAYKLATIYVAVGVLMISMTALIVWRRLTKRAISGMLWASTGLALVFGTATLLLHDIRFIQWKLTIYDWLVAVAFLISQFVGRQPLAQRFLAPAFGDELEVARRDWQKSNLAWVLFWALMGGLNIYVFKNFSESSWVNFKVIGTTVLLLVFMAAQVFWLHRRARPIAASSSSTP